MRVIGIGETVLDILFKDDQPQKAVPAIETVSTVGAGDNFNAGYIYATLRGFPDQASRIAMASRWSQDVCRQMGNNISPELVASLQA